MRCEEIRRQRQPQAEDAANSTQQCCEAADRLGVSPNKKLVEAHVAAKPAKAVEVLTDDFVWTEWADGVPADGVQTRGKAAFVQGFGDDDLRDDIQRVIE